MISGKRIVLTGEFADLDRVTLEGQLKALGGHVTTSISSKTDLVLAGDSPGPSKLAKAKELGVPVAGAACLHALIAGKNWDEALAAHPTSASLSVDRITAKPADTIAATPANLLLPQAQSKLLAKLKKAEYDIDVGDAIEKVVPQGKVAADVVWDIAAQGKLPLQNPAVIEYLAVYRPLPPSAELLVAAWHRIDWKTMVAAQQWRGAPTWLLYVLGKAVQLDPTPWRALAAHAPEPLADIVAMVLLELTKEVPPAAARERLISAIMDTPFAPGFEFAADNLLHLGIADAEVGRMLLAKLPADGQRPKLWQIEPLLRAATPNELGDLLARGNPDLGEARVLSAVLRQRSDSVEELVALGASFMQRFPRGRWSDQCTQAIADVALERCAEAKVTPPESLDPLLTLRWEWGESPDTRHLLPPGLANLPASRLQACIREDLAHGDEFRHACIPAIGLVFSTSLCNQALAWLRTKLKYKENRYAISVGLIGSAAIPQIEEELAKASDPEWAHNLRTAMLAAAFTIARDGNPVDARLDRYLVPTSETTRPLARDFFSTLMDLLPDDRARAIVGAWTKYNRQSVVSSDKWNALWNPPESSLERIRRLVAETGMAADTRIYVLEREETRNPKAHNRICAQPLGLAKVPQWEGEDMEHVFTLAIDSVPELRERHARFRDAEAIALFISSRDRNSAYEPDSGETEVVLLSGHELARGHAEQQGHSFQVHPINVPRSVFDAHEQGPLNALRRALGRLPARVLGPPLWVQEDLGAEDGDFILQFNELFADVNLGDSGTIYVFSDCAFWQGL